MKQTESTGKSITDQNLKEKMTIAGEHHYRNFFELSITGNYLSTPEGMLLDCNQAFVSMLGYSSRDELLATDMEVLYPMPSDRNLFLEKLKKDKTLVNAEIDLMRKDGRMIQCIENVVGVFDENGVLVQFMGYMIDITQYKENEKQVSILAQTIKSITESVSITDLNDKIIFINDAFKKTYGYENSELIGKHISMLRPPDYDAVRLEAINRETLRGGWQGEMINRKKDGTLFPIALSTSPVKNAKGRVIAFVGVATDITERKLTEQAISESEQKFSIAFKSSPYAIIITRMTDGRIIETNESLHRITGYSATEVIENSSLSINLWVNPADRNQVISDLKNNIPVHGREYFFRRKDGEIMTGLFGAELIVINNEQCILSSVNDITDRKIAEEKLREREQLWHTIIKTSPDGIAIATLDGIVSEISDRACKMYGYNKPEEILGRHILEFLDEKCHEKARERIHELLAGTYNGVAEYEAIKMDGSRFYVEINSAILRDKEGKPTHLFFIERDVTARKMAEEQLLKSEERFRLLVKNSSDIIVVINSDGIQTFVSQAVEKITGYTPEEVSNKHISDIVHPDDLPEINRVWNDALLSSPKIHKVQYRHIHKTRGWVHVEAIGQSFLDDPEILAVVVSVRDMTERMEAESARKESETRLQTLINASPDIICFKDGDGRWLIANNAELELFQLSDVDYKGKTDLQLSDYCNPVYKEALRYCMETDEKTWQSRSETIFEEIIYKPDGVLVVYEVIKVPVFHDDGSRKGIVVLGRNITDRKRTELIHKVQYNIADAMVTARNLNELFEKVREELKVLVDTSNIFIAFYNEKTDMLSSPFIKNEKGDTIRSWPAANSLTGLIVHQKKSMLLSKNEIAQLAEEGIISLRGSRSEKWLGVPLEISEKVIGAIVVQSFDNPDAYDNTSREILEIIANQLSVYIEQKKSDEQSRKLSAAIVQSPESIVITDNEGTIEYVNPKFTELTGYTAEEAIGQNPRILKSGEQSSSFYSLLWETIKSGKRWTGELRNKKKTGELYWESANISPIVDEAGNITHFVAVKEDITEKKKILEELVAAKDKAEAANRLKTAFMNNISHEVRTPLNCILGFGEALLDTDITEAEKMQHLKILNANSDRLINTITGYMDIALIASGNVEVHPDNVSPDELMDALFMTYKPVCKDKRIDLKLSLPEKSFGFLLKTDQELLKKILTHLLDNAVKFTHQGHIHFGYSINLQGVEFFVTDTGSGISKDFQSRIFERFAQEDSSLTRKFEGSGLGLAIVKGLCDLLGAKIHLVSQKDYGTSFYIGFSTSGSDKKEEKPAIQPKQTSKPIILIAEDEIDNFAYLEIVLKKIGATILYAVNGKEAVDMCQAHPEINIVFMDLKMPVMNGLEATQIIKSHRKDLPIVAVTAYAMSGDERRALSGGCDDYVSKPVKKDMILSKLKKYGLYDK